MQNFPKAFQFVLNLCWSISETSRFKKNRSWLKQIMKNVDLLHNDPITHRLKSTIDRVKMMSWRKVWNVYTKQSLWLSRGRKKSCKQERNTFGEDLQGWLGAEEMCPKQQMLQFYTANEGNEKMPNTQCQCVEWWGCELQDTRLLCSHFGGHTCCHLRTRMI